MLLFLLVSVSGCSNSISYQPVPAAYLQPCLLPELPQTNAELSDAFVQAFLCARTGNQDKQSIQDLMQP